jgi:hypothetical protein
MMCRSKSLRYITILLYLAGCLVTLTQTLAAAEREKPVASIGVWKSADGKTHYSYNGKEVSAPEFNRRCDFDRKRKASFEYDQHPAANKDELVKMIIIEAQCSGATHIGFSGIDQYN